MLRGNLLDSYVDAKNNKMITWIINNGKAARIIDKFEPSFYVYAPQQNLFKLAANLQDIPQIKNLNFTKKKLTLGSGKKHLVLEVTPKYITSLQKIASMIDYWGKCQTYDLFNVDIRSSTWYLHSKGVFCNAQVKWDGKQFILDDEQWAIDYKVPEFKILRFDIKRKLGVQSLNDPLISITIDKHYIEEENETDTILAAIKHIRKIDPDIILTKRGDSLVLPYLYHRAKECNISKQVNLGRDLSHKKRPVKKAKSYFSYGQIVYRPAFYTLQGRAHIDTKSSFMYGESGLRGIVDISRCANIPLQLQSRLGPGTAISQMQMNKAMEKGYLIPWKKNMPENCKSARQLLISDRGGLILSPVVGIHDDVVELDFASLYPTIMLRFNISPETMLCKCCSNSSFRVPQLNYHICTQHQGLIPEVLKPIIYRRFCFKARTKNKKYDTRLYNEIQQAWKWVLVVCFGYTGYRNARYGRIECHESITAYAREILLDAIEVAEKAGYSVLHGIVDSLWVKTKKNCENPPRLSRLISQKTGIRMDVEGRYKWIVFLPSKQHNVGALTRYYGAFTTGELKVRGVEIRQRNTPIFLKNMQSDMLKIFSKANNSQEFREMMPIAVEKMLEHGRKIIECSIDHLELVFKTRIAKDITEYKVNNLAKSALLQSRDTGIIVAPGQSIHYIVTNEHSRNYKERVCILESLSNDTSIDVNYYLRQIAKCAESILVPFGFSLEEFETMLHRQKNKEENYASVLSRVRTHQACI